MAGTATFKRTRANNLTGSATVLLRWWTTPEASKRRHQKPRFFAHPIGAVAFFLGARYSNRVKLEKGIFSVAMGSEILHASVTFNGEQLGTAALVPLIQRVLTVKATRATACARRIAKLDADLDAIGKPYA